MQEGAKAFFLVCLAISLCYLIPFALVGFGMRLDIWAYPFIFSCLTVIYAVGYQLKYRGQKPATEQRPVDTKKALNEYIEQMKNRPH
jgi:uncharacterized membrane protein